MTMGGQQGCSNITQMIDYDGNIVSDLKSWMLEHKLSNLGFDYNVIAILGSQSSGKSTLLNNLFSTSFDVMDTKKGHSQTTKGLWMSYELFEKESEEETENDMKNESNTTQGVRVSPTSSVNKGNKRKINPALIIDVEGTDSKERGDDRLTFEHRSALLCLALADCVIVNLWYHSLGNFTASNYGLLKTVMEVNLELFQQDVNCPKTILLFTVRDWFEDLAPLDVIKKKIIDDYLNKIWKEIKKSDAVEKFHVENFFTIEVVGLSHAIIKKEEFQKDISRLRKKWVEELKPLQYSRNIPSDGFGQYCSNIWNTIIKQSQLDIPSQKEMLATFRCQEIKNNVISNISETIKAKLELSHHQIIDNFREWAEKEVTDKCLNEYLADASRYKENICVKTADELLDTLCAQLQSIVDNNLNFIQRGLALKFARDLSNMYSICTKGKGTFSFSNTEHTLGNKEGEEEEDDKQKWDPNGDSNWDPNWDPSKNRKNSVYTSEENKCIHMWNNFLYNTERMEHETLFHFYEDYRKCNIKIKNGVIHEFNYKPTLNTLIISIDKDTNRIKNTQFSHLLNKTKNTINEKLKTVDNLLVNAKTSEDFWMPILDITRKLEENISKYLTKCFINLMDKEKNEEDGLLQKNEHEKGKMFFAMEKKGNHLNSSSHNDNLGYKLDVIRKNEQFVSTINADINRMAQDPEFLKKLKEFYLEHIIDILRKKLTEIVDNLSHIMVQRFEQVFNYDETEQPRQWKDISAIELKNLFRDSKNHAFFMVEILQKTIKVDIIDEYLQMNFVKEELIEKAKNKAKKKMQELCRDAQYIQATGGTIGLKNVPFLFWLLLLFFGWNEIVSCTKFFFRLNIFLPVVIAVIVVISSYIYGGNSNSNIISCLNKAVFFLARNSYELYKHVQQVNRKGKPVVEIDSD